MGLIYGTCWKKQSHGGWVGTDPRSPGWVGTDLWSPGAGSGVAAEVCVWMEPLQQFASSDPPQATALGSGGDTHVPAHPLETAVCGCDLSTTEPPHTPHNVTCQQRNSYTLPTGLPCHCHTLPIGVLWRSQARRGGPSADAQWEFPLASRHAVDVTNAGTTGPMRSVGELARPALPTGSQVSEKGLARFHCMSSTLGVFRGATSHSPRAWTPVPPLTWVIPWLGAWVRTRIHSFVSLRTGAGEGGSGWRCQGTISGAKAWLFWGPSVVLQVAQAGAGEALGQAGWATLSPPSLLFGCLGLAPGTLALGSSSPVCGGGSWNSGHRPWPVQERLTQGGRPRSEAHGVAGSQLSERKVLCSAGLSLSEPLW